MEVGQISRNLLGAVAISGRLLDSRRSCALFASSIMYYEQNIEAKQTGLLVTITCL